MRKIGFYAGSFDPFTKGHLAIVCEALCRFNTVIIGIGVNPTKKTMFLAQERKAFVLSSIEDFKQSFEYRVLCGVSVRRNEENAAERLKNEPDCLRVVTYSDLTVDAALRCGATALIRGERDAIDEVEEARLEAINEQLLEVRHRKLRPVRIQSPYLCPELKFVSSSAVKALFEMGEYIAAMNHVMPSVHAAMARSCLKERYCAAFKRNLSGSWKSLNKAYSTAREYHTFSHLAYCFNYVKIFQTISASDKVNLSEDDRNCLDVAIFWHDFYCGMDNAEEKSADALETYFNENLWYFRHYLFGSGFEFEQSSFKVRQQKRKEELGVFRIKDLILATKHSAELNSSDALAMLVHDVDLAILGDTVNYETYAMQVRREYADCSTEDYAKARIAVLQSLRSRERLFLTDFFHEILEEPAKANIRREIAFWQNVH